MPLAELQTALGMMVASQAAARQLPVTTQTQLDALALTKDEQHWLASLPNSRGFQVTCDIQRWWRETRLRETARLTLAALGADKATALITAYLCTHLCHSLFFLPETLDFLSFVLGTSDHPHLSSVAQFERALLLAREEAARSVEEGAQPVTETIVTFAAPPEEVLAALLQGHALPEVRAESYPVVVAANLPHFWQPLGTMQRHSASLPSCVLNSEENSGAGTESFR